MSSNYEARPSMCVSRLALLAHRRVFYVNANRYRLAPARRNDFTVASFAPQTEHLPSAAIFGCSFTSAPQSPHFGIESPPHEAVTNNLIIFLRIKAMLARYQEIGKTLDFRAYSICARFLRRHKGIRNKHRR